MTALFVTALLALGIITSSDQATPEIVEQHKVEINAYIGELDDDTM